MKHIKYQVLGYSAVYNPETEDIEQKETFAKVIVPYSEENEQAAKNEAYNGEYTIEDDGTEDFSELTKLDVLEAQVTYTAMMTDTLLEV